MKKGSLSCVKKGEARTMGGRREMGDTDRPVIISLILDMRQHVFIMFSNQYISISRKQAGNFFRYDTWRGKCCDSLSSGTTLLTEGNAEENTYIAVLGEQTFVQEFII